MIVALALLLAATEDPRIPLAELQLQERHREALVRVETELGDTPEAAGDLGFHYLRGHLLEELGRRDEAQRAFRDAMSALPQLSSYSLFRLAQNQLRLQHPEVAAGLLTRLLGDNPPQPLLRPAADLLLQAIEAGGDCGLVDHYAAWNLTGATRRSMQLAWADCRQREGQTAVATRALLELLKEELGDDVGRGAAERLNRLQGGPNRNGSSSRIVGLAFYRHRLFNLSILHLSRELGNPATWQAHLSGEDDFETLYALARSNFWNGNYIQAASQFGQLAAAVEDTEEKGRALYQQGRCYELSGNWDTAIDSYRRAYLADPTARYADAGLMSALRLEWRTGSETSALELYELLGTRRNWASMLRRASLFLAASDIVRGRYDRAGDWLARPSRSRGQTDVEISYWSGRLAETRSLTAAVGHYIEALVEDAYHPLSRAALRRVGLPELAPAALARARSLAQSSRGSDLYAAWLVLGDERPEGEAARERLIAGLRGDSRVRPFLEVDARAPSEWPLWQASLTQPEERLLSLGVWEQGSSVVLKHFPITDPSLAYTGGQILAQAQQARPSIYVGELLAKRVPSQMPSALLPRRIHELLYPLPYAELINKNAETWGIDPLLLAALMREESRFDPDALSAASARGLAQFVLPTAQRLAAKLGIENLAPRDLHRPDVSIMLGAAYMAELAEEFGNGAHFVLAAYNAGEDQTRVWRSYCYSSEPEEFYSKVGFTETRNYLRKVLSSREHYAQLYE